MLKFHCWRFVCSWRNVFQNTLHINDIVAHHIIRSSKTVMYAISKVRAFFSNLHKLRNRVSNLRNMTHLWTHYKGILVWSKDCKYIINAVSSTKQNDCLKQIQYMK